jgi:hypothetical protein
MGRKPLPYDALIGDEICDRLANGESLRKISLDEHVPAASTIFKWLTENEDFAEQYARAREAQADTLADEILDIADDGSNDYMGEDKAYDGDAVQRSKLRVDARKWVAAKLKPKKYGDKLDLTSGGEKIGLPAEIEASRRRIAEGGDNG